MPATQADDESRKFSYRSKFSSLSGNGAHSNKESSCIIKSKIFDEVTNTIYPVKRKSDDSITTSNISTISDVTKRPRSDLNMLNGYRSFDVHSRTTDDGSHSNSMPIATLFNMGNTCYLNSVLYTLRFAPSFVHNLHHLVADIALIHSKINQTKAKSSSLGRTISSITGPSSRSSSSKDLLSLGNSQNDLHPKTKRQIATEKLHELYMSLHSLEMKDGSESYQPASFLQALTEVNSIYQGNQQQDAHELLVYLLDILREACDTIATQAEHQSDSLSELLSENSQPSSNTSTLTSKARGVRRSWKKNKDSSSKKNKEKIKEETVNNDSSNNEADDQCATENNGTPVEKFHKKIGYNFVSEDFGGITLRRTKCLECESISELKEPFYDICVPVLDINFDGNESDFYRQACLTTENLQGTNKYWCEQCIRYNEARREVSYERLPNLLVLQLKRFSTTANGTEKINTYIPSPLILECFCDKCAVQVNRSKLHSYQLYAVIMHVGSTMASGHYIAYTRASDYHYEYVNCCRDNSKFINLSTNSTEKSLNFLKFLKPKSINSSSSSSSGGGSSNHHHHHYHHHSNSYNNSNSHNSGHSNSSSSDGNHLIMNNCKSVDCCGVKFNKSVIENINNTNKDGKLSMRNHIDSSSLAAGASHHLDENQLWLECDDDNVRTISTKEFQKLLSCKRNSPATPYLLFYSKIKETMVHEENGSSD